MRPARPTGPRERRQALMRLAVAGFGMMQAMIYAVALYAGALDGIDGPSAISSASSACSWRRRSCCMPAAFLHRRLAHGACAHVRWTCRWRSPSAALCVAAWLPPCAALAPCTSIRRSCSCSSCCSGATWKCRCGTVPADHDALARLLPAHADRRTRPAAKPVGVHELAAGDRSSGRAARPCRPTAS